jgi:serine beta-lactamase-like protein LACTB
LILAAWLLLVSPVTSGARPPLPQEASIESVIEAARVNYGIPGISAAVVLDGEIRFSRGFGLADVENDIPATEETVYRLGSVSKPIAATALMQLAEEGRLDLDAPIQKYVPTFPEKPWPITSRELLGHLGGIRHYAPGELESTRHYFSLAQALSIFKSDPLVAEPGTRYTYSTYGYTLLGCVLEGAAGKTFPDYLRERIFEPAEMKGARVDDVFELIPHRAQGYERDTSGGLRNSGLADTSYKTPGGGLCATARDVAHFAMAFEDGRLVREETRGLMISNQKTRSGKRTGYGLGWALDKWKGHREVFHGGGQQRVSTLLYLHPDTSLTVVLLANLEGVRPALLATARQVAEILGR